MASKEVTYQPLERSSDENSDDGLLQHYAKNTQRQRWQRWSTAALVLSVLALVISNGVWIGVYQHQKNARGHFPVLSPYRFSTPYSEGNLSQQNPLWNELFPRGGGAVKVDAQWAIDNKLQLTQGYAPDGKAIYVVGMYHQLHCLAVIRTSLYQFHNGREQTDPWSHIPHCLDALRQALQCLADPTLGGNGALHECRDFEALKAWTDEHAYIEYMDN
ncbi:hypothetical protein GQX73_g9470 [Xylaria multiplex]|uniref:Oxidase ustYa n=1 Tax=Xylaria multiplex TaxID=323545 RepID=A0A7C8MMY8_9PEZI|nr:hypothetical protein GQX73_g9470 [Xylaria multiplex]